MNTPPSLFSSIDQLPDPYAYPTNIRQKTKEILTESFSKSSSFTVVTGFSSLEFIIQFFGALDWSKDRSIRIVLGNEPLFSDLRRALTPTSLPQEITDYWLQQNIAAYLCWPILNLMEQIRNDKVQFRLLEGLHAKIYVGEHDAILGSSNFSQSGLSIQKEANVRTEKGKQPEQYQAFKSIADYYFEQGRDAKDFILGLLEQLLRLVSWQESLARAVGELLEGDKVRQEMQAAKLFNDLDPPLWGVQEEALGQALYVLDHFGSVLIADATGSGKTRLGAALQLCLKNRVLINGGSIRDMNTLLITPPQVMDTWRQELIKMDSGFENIMSQGALSRESHDVYKSNKVENARIIILDEAHNYLNENSKRSGRLQFNTADQLIMLTATPINRRFEDIFRLIEIMDIDNLDDEALENYLKLYKTARKGARLSQHDKSLLQSYLSQFLVRRTKRELNRRVDINPELHRLSNGRLCRYPEQKPDVYPLNEDLEDVALARQINALASQLRGIIRLRGIFLKPEERTNPDIERQRMEQRIHAAKALTQYFIQASLRSSNAALIEHIEGSVVACHYLDVIELPLRKFKEDKETGNMLSKVQAYKKSLPEHNLSIPLPDWLSDTAQYQKACDEEIETYKAIVALARKLTLRREREKAKFLNELLKKHDLVLCFDRNIITLNVLHRILKTEFKSAKPLLVTASNKSNQELAKKYFALGSKEKQWIGLCSEVMSEGVNLQQASAVVLLDVPGVMRIAEQRIGRIDRMNSPHDTVEIYFPDDHPEFALRTDRKFFLTAQVVDDMIGGNVDLPEAMLDKWDLELITGKEIAEQYKVEHEKAAQSYADGIQDAFQPVRDLVSGTAPLIDPDTYLEIRHSKVTLTSLVKTSASFVSADQNWGFICLQSTATNSSNWIFITETTGKGLFPQYKMVRSIPEICMLLGLHLSAATDINDPEDIAALQPLSKRLFEALRVEEINSLPNKKRRAIKLLKELMEHYLKTMDIDTHRRNVLSSLLKLLRPIDSDTNVVDYYQLARNWIRAIQPFIVEERKKKMRNQPTVHLGSIQKIFKKLPLPTSIFEELIQKVVMVPPIEKRVAAFIIGAKK